MLNILDNIDTVNYIVQDVVQKAMMRPLEFRNGLVKGDGYILDFTKGVNQLEDYFRIRTDRMQNLCMIYMEKGKFHIRYNAKFVLTYKVSTGMITCNLFDEPFTLQDMEATFFMQSTIGFGLPLSVEFSHDTMSETIQLCRSLYDVFISFVQAKNV